MNTFILNSALASLSSARSTRRASLNSRALFRACALAFELAKNKWAQQVLLRSLSRARRLVQQTTWRDSKRPSSRSAESWAARRRSSRRRTTRYSTLVTQSSTNSDWGGTCASGWATLRVPDLQTVLALREVTEHVHRVSQLEAIVHLQGEQLTSNDTLVASLRDEIAVLSQRSPRPHTLDSAEAAAAQDSFGEAQQPQPQPQPQQQQQQQKTELQQQQEQQLHQEIKRLTDTLEKLRGELSASKAELEGINNKVCLIFVVLLISAQKSL